MPLYIVRHAKAGDRAAWEGPDEARPVSKKGRRQADAIAAMLADEPVSRVLSSPYLRCIQTVEPLAAKRGLEVEVVEALAEGQPFEPVLDLLATLPDHAVLCSHGDLIPDTMHALARRGMVLDSEPDWRKGVTWVLERNGDSIVRARVIPPPADT